MTDKVIKFDGEESSLLLRCTAPAEGEKCIKIEADSDDAIIAVKTPGDGDTVLIVPGEEGDVIIATSIIRRCTFENGGFETGVLTPWEIGTTYNANYDIDVAAYAKRSGNYGLHNHLHIIAGEESYSCYTNITHEIAEACEWQAGDHVSIWLKWVYVDWPSLPGYYSIDAYIDYFDPGDESWHQTYIGGLNYGWVGTWINLVCSMPDRLEGYTYRLRIRNYLHRAYTIPPGYYWGPTQSTLYFDDIRIILNE